MGFTLFSLVEWQAIWRFCYIASMSTTTNASTTPPFVQITVTGQPDHWCLRVTHDGHDDKGRHGSSVDFLVSRLVYLFVTLPASMPVRLEVFQVLVPWLDARELAEDVRLVCELLRRRPDIMRGERAHADVDDIRAEA